METRKVKVTLTGHFEIRADELESAYESKTFDGALENQRRWLNEGMTTALELFDEGIEDIKLEFEDKNDK